MQRINYNTSRLRVVAITASVAVAAATFLALATLSRASAASASSSSSAFLLATPASKNYCHGGILPPSASIPSSSSLVHNIFSSKVNPLQFTRPTSSSTTFIAGPTTTRSSQQQQQQQQQLKRHSPRTICYYKDEWLDAEIKLAAFNLPRRLRPPSKRTQRRRNLTSTTTSTSTASSRSPSSKTILQQLFLPILKLYLHLKESIRTKLERSTVYILQCENNKYYVGSTTNRLRRYHQHMHRRGSKWTKMHKPISLLKEYRRIPSIYLLGMESKVTAQLMLQYGVNNVRGSMFCSVRNYHMGDIDALTKFLGHYNDLEYGRVYSKLCRLLPPPPGDYHVGGGGGGEEGGGGGGWGGRRGKQRRQQEKSDVDATCKVERSEADGQLDGSTTDVAP